MGEMVKAGLPVRMREWMSGRPGPFNFRLMCIGLDIPQGPVRYYVARSLQAFIRRGEVQRADRAPSMNPEVTEKMMAGVMLGSAYRYNHSWRRASDAPLKKRILRSMRLISFHDSFSAADVQNLAGAPERSYVDLLIRNLVKENYIHRVGVQACLHGVGKEAAYRVVDLAKFRLDLL